MKTITLQWKNYAQVAERIKEIHKDYKNVSITTDFDTIGDKWFAKFRATVKIKDGEMEKVFTAHAFGMYTALKSYEKTETIAVGRALAYAGYLADGEVASYEEIEEFIKESK